MKIDGFIHGQIMACPICGEAGKFDEMRKKGFDGHSIAEYKNAIWKNSYTNEWEC